MSAGRRQRRRQEQRAQEAAQLEAERAEIAARGPLHVLDLPVDLSEQLLRRRRRVQTADAFLDALYELREAVAEEPTARSAGASLAAYGTTLADDGQRYAAAHPRLSLEVHQFLEELERIWATLQPEERRVLHLGRDHTYAGILDTLIAERVRTALGTSPTVRWVQSLVVRAHQKIERQLRGAAG